MFSFINDFLILFNVTVSPIDYKHVIQEMLKYHKNAASTKFEYSVVGEEMYRCKKEVLVGRIASGKHVANSNFLISEKRDKSGDHE